MKKFGIKKLKPSPFSVESRLPSIYVDFMKELGKTPSPVHYYAEPGKWKMHPVTKEKLRIENVPIPLKFPKEADKGIWGGEGVVQGFIKDKPLRRRFPNYWVPVLKKAVVYSEILNKYMSITLTERTLQLIDKHFGFDNYILETPVQDLKSQLALDIRREMLLTMANKVKCYEDTAQQERVYEKYKRFIIPKEEAEWFGLTLREAVKKQKLLEEETMKPEPLKHQYRRNFIEQLIAKKANSSSSYNQVEKSLLSRMPFFGKSKEEKKTDD